MIKVLVADDEAALRELVSECVSQLGYAVVTASDGSEAWQRAKSERPDLLVLDVMMPGMSGWEVCKLVKAQPNAPYVLMLTGIGERLNDMTAPLYGADAWVDKPFDIHELAERVRALANAAKKRRSEPPATSSGPTLYKAVQRAPGSEPKAAGSAKSGKPKAGKPKAKAAAKPAVKAPAAGPAKAGKPKAGKPKAGNVAASAKKATPKQQVRKSKQPARTGNAKPARSVPAGGKSSGKPKPGAKPGARRPRRRR